MFTGHVQFFYAHICRFPCIYPSYALEWKKEIVVMFQNGGKNES